MAEYEKKMKQWEEEPLLDEALKEELRSLRQRLDRGEPEAREEAEDRFYKDLEFGTGGLRGILGAGTNRMNRHTVGKAVQGFADALRENAEPGGKRPSVAVAYDSRIQSDFFARTAARILQANDIDVFLYPKLMPTPALSFAVRYYGCDGGIMITASHNPSRYNGLKIYNRYGCQASLEESDRILKKILVLDAFRDVKETGGTGTLTMIPPEAEEAYLEAVMQLALPVRWHPEDVSVVFTPLNGTGGGPVRRVLERAGIRKIHIVEEQAEPDGNFPTCPYPNPEKEEALERAISLFRKRDAEGETPDLLIATDPDADRIGVACMCRGRLKILTGNEVGVLLLDFICRHRKLPENPLAVRTIVSTKMTDPVAGEHGVEIAATLTGFKFIGEQINRLEDRGCENRFIFGFEESVGYLSGTHARDKDAVNAALLICQMAGFYKLEGKTLGDRMEELYRQYGWHLNGLMEFAFGGPQGMETMGRINEAFRREQPEELGGLGVREIIDYRSGVRRTLRGGDCCGMAAGTRPTGLPSSDVLEFVLDGGAGFAMRPSGTEPKFKIYLFSAGETKEKAEETLAAMENALRKKIQTITATGEQKA